MRCPHCGQLDSKVLDSRPAHEDREIRRRRECLHCHRRFTTYERIEDMPLWVVKKDGRREAFDRQKIFRGLKTACEKRPISLETLENLAEAIERAMRDQYSGEVSTQIVGEAAMGFLRDTDEVAYVRFASVYRQFADIEGFRQELERLLHPAAST